MQHSRLKNLATIWLISSLISGAAMATQGPRCEALFSSEKISVVGLSETDREQKALAERYLLHVADEYGKIPIYSTLPLLQRQSELAISPEYKDRSKLIVSTNGDRSMILGGVMVTYAAADQNLPLQDSKAFRTYKRPRDEGRVAEIKRLTAQEGGSSADPNRGKTLILLALKSIAEDPEVTHVYVHTSAIHARLYRMMGFRPESIVKYDDLNYLIRYTRAEVERHLRY